MFTTVDKAIVALIMSVLSILDLLFGINFGLGEGTVATIAALVGPILVWAVPNLFKPKVPRV